MNTLYIFFSGIIAMLMGLIGVTHNIPKIENPVATTSVTMQTTEVSNLTSLVVDGRASSSSSTTESHAVSSTTLSGGYINTKGYGYDFSYKNDPVNPGAEVPDYMIFISPSGEKFKVSDDIRNIINAPNRKAFNDNRTIGQSLSNFSMPIDQSDSGLIYLSTSELIDNTNASKVILRVYSYNLKTLHFKKIYEETRNDTTPMEFNTGTSTISKPVSLILKTVGIEGSNIIFADVLGDDSPGPCTNFWSYWGKYGFFYIDLDNLGKGLRKFSVPQRNLDESNLESEKCQEEIDSR